jgi:hypothetical protein
MRRGAIFLMAVLALGCRRERHDEQGQTMMQRDDLAIAADKADYIAAIQTELDRAKSAEARLDAAGQAARRGHDRIHAQRGVLQDDVRAIQRATVQAWPDLKQKVEKDLRVMSELTKEP